MDLICIPDTTVALLGSINYIGFALASMFGPRLSDLFGRKRVIIPGLIFCCVIEALMIFIARDFYSQMALFFFYGCSGTARISLIYLYLQELTPKKRSPIVGCMIHVVNGITSGMTVIYTRYIYSYWLPWQAIVLLIIALSTVAMFFIPESPKYLIAKRRYDEARDVLKLIA
jgi:MFS family permease